MTDSPRTPPSSSRKPAHHPPGGFGFHIGSGPSRSSGASPDTGPSMGVEGLLGGLSGLLKAISDLAEKGKDLQSSGNFTAPGGKEGSFHYGLNIRTLDSASGREVRVEPFGNIARDEQTGETVVHEWREPITDIMDEDTYVQVVLEMPGVDTKHITAQLDGDILSVCAENGSKRYRKELLLPGGPFKAPEMTLTSNSGVVQIRCPR